MAGAVWYLAYGSNMDARRMKARGVPFRAREHGILEGHRLTFNKRAFTPKGAGYANVVPNRRFNVEGVLYQITTAGLAALDHHEGVPEHYTRKQARVRRGEGYVNAWVYVAKREYTAPNLKPTDQYMVHLLAGADILSKPYTAVLKAFACIPARPVMPPRQRGWSYGSRDYSEWEVEATDEWAELHEQAQLLLDWREELERWEQQLRRESTAVRQRQLELRAWQEELERVQRALGHRLLRANDPEA